MKQARASSPEQSSSGLRAGSVYLIDVGQLRRQTLDDDNLLYEVLEMFRENVRLSLVALAGTAERDRWVREAHSLKGAARTIGASELAAVAEVLEQADWPLAEGDRRRLVERLDAALEATLGELHRLFPAR